MRAFILVGGLGTRLRGIGITQPKPMLEIAGKPFLEYLIRNLKKHGIDEIVLCVGHGAESVKKYFADGRRWHTSIFYSEETTPLGTAGAIKNAQKFAVKENLILNGDSFLALDYTKMLAAHRQNGALISIACTPIPETQDYGSIQIDSSGRISGFAEKVTTGEQGLISGGIYIFNKAAFDLIPANQKVSVEEETFPLAVATGRCYSFLSRGYFLDIGTPERLSRAQVELPEIFAGIG